MFKVRLTARSQGDAERGKIERYHQAVCAFASEWVTYARTKRQFVDLRKVTGLSRKAAAISFLQSLKSEEAGVPGGTHLNLLERVRSTITSYVAISLKANNTGLANELELAYLTDLGEWATGNPVGRRDRIDSLVARPSFHYEPPAGLSETEEQSLFEVRRRAYREEMTRWERDRRGSSRSPGANVERDARWLCRYLIRGVRVQKLGQEYIAACEAKGIHIEGNGHEQVLAALKRVSELLGIPLHPSKTKLTKTNPPKFT